VYGVATEDMDALTFGTRVLLRHLTFSEARKIPIKEFHLDTVLHTLQFDINQVAYIQLSIITATTNQLTLPLTTNHNKLQFIDLCILLGCDYCDSIRGIGPKRALELITKHKSIETIIEKIDKTKYTLPENWPFVEARRLFTDPDVEQTEFTLNWTNPDEEQLVQYLAHEKGTFIIT
jgi:flap endonuclease-1